jgi:tetratricopeptide (TPR) repeat protein
MGGGSAAAEPVGSVDVALAHAARLLQRDPQLAAEQAAEILKVTPSQPNATLILGIARRASGDPQAAREVLAALCTREPRWAPAHYELGVTLSALGRGEEALAELREAVRLNPEFPDAWRSLADHLAATGDDAAADAARARFLKVSTRDPRLMAAAAALCENRIPEAEVLLRRHLTEHPTDIAAIRMFAEVAARLGRYRDAENLLERCLELAPDFHAARHNYAVALFRQSKHAAAIPQVERLLALEPRSPNYRALKAAVLAGTGEYRDAIGIYEQIVAEYPHAARIWLSYGHALRTTGQSTAAIAAYRRAIALEPSMGEAFWSLANLKTFQFEAADVAAMRAQLARAELGGDERLHFHFALGKALEDGRDYGASFAEYRHGNAVRRAQIHYDGAENRAAVARARALFTPQFFAARAGSGSTAPDPIFIVGLPRAGSTLIEQILASHSQVEGTMELPDLQIIARTLPGVAGAPATRRFPDAIATLAPQDFRTLGEEYLARTRIHRKHGTPLFIDKMPNNFAHVGLIHLMLPNARIIDARRHPLGCCLSAFKQHFARGQSFSYELTELGGYYRDYVELMAHFDAVLPGRVHRVLHERLIDDTEAEVRRLLEYCGLGFEPGCLRFYENERAVRTASSEQVRTPIFRDGVDHWRHYAPWLAPLEQALGPVLAAYPEVPDFRSGSQVTAP